MTKTQPMKRKSKCAAIWKFLMNGPATTRDIANAIKRHRSIAGGMLRHMEKRGVVEVVHRGKSGDWTDCSVWKIV